MSTQGRNLMSALLMDATKNLRRRIIWRCTTVSTRVKSLFSALPAGTPLSMRLAYRDPLITIRTKSLISRDHDVTGNMLLPRVGVGLINPCPAAVIVPKLRASKENTDTRSDTTRTTRTSHQRNPKLTLGLVVLWPTREDLSGMVGLDY